jgi:hypothetical protein
MLQQADTQQKVLLFTHYILGKGKEKVLNSYIMTPEFLLTDSLTEDGKMRFSWNPGTKVMSLNVRERKSGEEESGGGGGSRR